jgi:hypothetical protein
VDPDAAPDADGHHAAAPDTQTTPDTQAATNEESAPPVGDWHW